MPARPTYKRRKHRRREVDGKFEYQCNTCRRWLSGIHFGKMASNSRWGYKTDCHQCLAWKEERRATRPALVQKRVRRYKARERIANEVYSDKRDVPQRFQHRSWARTDKLLAAAETVLRRHSEDDILELTGIHARMLRSFLDGTGKNISIRTAEKLEVELDDYTLLDEFLPDWNRAGLKRCKECGTNVHPHQGKGLCRLCYHRDYYGMDPRVKGRGRWAQYHECCLGCGTVERKHDANGYCTRCTGRIKAHGAPITMRLCVCGCNREFELNDKRRLYYSASCKDRMARRRKRLRGQN